MGNNLKPTIPKQIMFIWTEVWTENFLEVLA